VLAREHQLQQRGVARGEADVGRRGRLQARLEVLARPPMALRGSAPQAREAGLGERVEQRLAIGEMTRRGAPWLTPTSRASSRSDSSCTPRLRTVRAACSSGALRRLLWWYGRSFTVCSLADLSCR
jgi:hypothetical protein